MANGLEIVLSDPAVQVGVRERLRRHHLLRRGRQRHRVRGRAARRSAARRSDRPIVVRLDGNKAAEGRQILADAALPVVEQVDTMDGAARRAAELAAAKGA